MQFEIQFLCHYSCFRAFTHLLKALSLEIALSWVMQSRLQSLSFHLPFSMWLSRFLGRAVGGVVSVLVSHIVRGEAVAAVCDAAQCSLTTPRGVNRLWLSAQQEERSAESCLHREVA